MMFTHTDSSVNPGVKTGQAQGECEVLQPAKKKTEIASCFVAVMFSKISI